jgi:RimJ/RimL family protein N-acetyltransferase
MVELVPFSEAELQAFLDVIIPDYAEEHVRAGDWQPGEAIKRSRAEFDELLPQGLATPDHYLFSIRDAASGQKVGMLWFHARRRGGKSSAFVYNIEIDPPFQRRGYATGALAALDEQALALGLAEIELHVFGHNKGALALYEKCGFETTHVMMAKTLTRPA